MKRVQLFMILCRRLMYPPFLPESICMTTGRRGYRPPIILYFSIYLATLTGLLWLMLHCGVNSKNIFMNDCAVFLPKTLWRVNHRFSLKIHFVSKSVSKRHGICIREKRMCGVVCHGNWLRCMYNIFRREFILIIYAISGGRSTTLF